MPYGLDSKSPEFAEFQQLLIGTWTNDPELAVEVDKKTRRPLSYNVMPLPQVEPQPGRKKPKSGAYGGFILKNFAFRETIRFNGTNNKKDAAHQDPEAVAVVAGAPNRGGTYTQFAHSVFYEQQVRFAEGPEDGKIVHLENGAWLHLGSVEQKVGPYSPPGKPLKDGQVLRQPPYVTIAKQIAVPHGNSVLALGSIDLNDRGDFKSDKEGLDVDTVFSGPPVIPDQFVPYPEEADQAARQTLDIATPPYYDPYSQKLATPGDFENPSIEWTLNPNLPLQLAVEMIEPRAHMHWRVTTLEQFGGDSQVTNIPFEERKSDVTEYWADYWLLSKDRNAKRSGKFDYLLYNQTVLMEMEISTDGGKTYKKYVFPHITSNVVKKVAGTPTQARAATKTPLE